MLLDDPTTNDATYIQINLDFSLVDDGRTITGSFDKIVIDNTYNDVFNPEDEYGNRKLLKFRTKRKAG
jgi:hypothetical protein